VPLRKDGKLLGIITANRREVRPFLDSQIALLESFAAQAVIAMDNARLITETREALEQQTATAEVLQTINSSPGDLAPVFDAILDKAHSLCGAVHGILATYDGEHARAVATHGISMPSELLRQPFRPTPNSAQARVVREGRPIHIPDLMTEALWEREDPERIAAIKAGGVRTMLFVPLRKDDARLGWITANRLEVRPFSDNQIALLQNFATQAVIAMENARLLTETREALEQQTATAEVLQVINSSPGDLAPVFDAILEKAHTLCGAATGVLLIRDGEEFRLAAVDGEPPFVEAWRRRGPVRPTEQRAAAQLASGEVVHLADARSASLYDDPERRRMLELSGARTLLVVPLHREGEWVGTITAGRREVRPFSDKQVALLQNFAAQAVIAMENARLLGELRERTGDLQESLEYQTATSDVLKVISRSGAELEPVLDTLVETAARLCEADKAMIYRLSDGLYRTAASFGFPPEYKDFIEHNPITPSRGTLTGRTVIERCAVHIEDAAADPEYTWTESQQRGNLRTLLGVPLFREDVVVGAIALGRSRVERFTEKQIALVTTFADQAVIAMENARLLGELHQRTDEVAELNRGLEARVAEQVDELGRVGRLKRFLAPQLAELIVSHGDEKILESHRREIVVVFCDLRGYTAFTETAEPEEVLDFLREYHGALGPLVSQFEGTLNQFSGDGIMVFFNDPVPIPDPAERAVRMAIAMREAAGALITDWRRRDRELGFGAGIAQGYATLGQIGFAERSGYTAIGTVCNLAARLCAEAKDGQILIAGRVAAAVEKVIALEDRGSLALKGLTQPVSAFNVPLAATPSALRVIEGGPPSV
jgi:adenylate cyclase